MRKFTKIVHAAVMRGDSPPVAEIAERLDKAASTVYGELSPYETPGSTAKLGLEDAVTIMRMLDNDALAHALCREFGLEADTQEPITPDKGTIHEEMLDDFPPLTAFDDAIRNGEEVDTVRELMDTHIREVRETFALYESQHYDSRRDGVGHVVRGGKMKIVGR